MSGSDLVESEVVAHLREQGIAISIVLDGAGVAVKAAAWEKFKGDGYGSLHLSSAAMGGFQWYCQKDLLAPYAERFFEETGRKAEIVKVNGSVELAPLVGLSDGIVDLVATGRTLRENGLVERDRKSTRLNSSRRT